MIYILFMSLVLLKRFLKHEILFYFFLSNIFIDNFVLVKFLGLCPFMGTSKKIHSAIGMSLSTSFIIVVSSFFLWFINSFFLVPFDLTYLRVIVYILIISCSVQLLEIILKHTSPLLYRVLGIFLPLITTNCAVLAVPLFSLYLDYTLMESIAYGVSASFGCSLVMVIFSSMRERIMLLNVPLAFQGAPIALISASLMSIVFMGFKGLIKN